MIVPMQRRRWWRPVFVAMVLFVASAERVPAQDCAYVSATLFDSLAILNLSAGELSAMVPVGKDPVGVAVSRDGSFVYVAHEQGHDVAVVSATSHEVLATIPVGMHPYDIAVGADDTLAYVANLRSNSISVIDTTTRTVASTIGTNAEGPARIVLGPDGRRAYTANLFGNSVSVIDLESRSTIRVVRVGERPYGIAIRPDSSEILAANTIDGTVSIVRTVDPAVVATVAVGFEVSDVAVHPGGAFAYVSAADVGAVGVIDLATRTLIRSIALPAGNYSGIAFSSDGARAYVAEFTYGNVFVIDAQGHEPLHFITIGGGSAIQRLAVARVEGGCPLPFTPTPTPTVTRPPTPTPTPPGLPAPILVAPVSAEQTFLDVDRGDAFPMHGTLRIGAELVSYSARDGGRLVGVQRGLGGTSPQAHAAGSIVALVGQRGDANCDGARTAADLPAFAGQLRAVEPGPCGGDFDGDGSVTMRDLAPLLSALY